MKVAIYANEGRRSTIISQRLKKKFADTHFIYDEKNPDIVVTVGGDGTLLSAFHKYAAIIDTVRFVSVHTGHLGFYTDWREDEIDDLVVSLQSDNGQAVNYPLLDIRVKYQGLAKAVNYLALNESTLKRTALLWSQMFTLAVNFLKNFVETDFAFQLQLGRRPTTNHWEVR